MTSYEFGRTSRNAIQKYPDILKLINLKDGVDWMENFNAVTGIHKIDDELYDLERYGASVESKILLYYSRQK